MRDHYSFVSNCVFNTSMFLATLTLHDSEVDEDVKQMFIYTVNVAKAKVAWNSTCKMVGINMRRIL